MTDDSKTDKQLQSAERRRTSRIPRFYRLSVEQRLAFLQRTFDLSNDEIAMLRDGRSLRIEHAVNMVENAIGVLGVPLGIGLNFLVDDREFLIPMAIEEASIIAAASKAALIIRGCGGFCTEVDPPLMIGQIQLLDVADSAHAREQILNNRERILTAANQPNQRMVKRGGGAFDLEVREIPSADDCSAMVVVHLLIDVREAMGANAVNYACEAAGPVIEAVSGGRVNLRIVSNYATRRLARASFSLPVDRLSTPDLTCEQVAQRLVEASRLAEYDPWRAATHNKGIFNGICAAALAMGQDWRAIEAGGHAYAARNGRYQGLTSYRILDGSLVGEIELPLQVGWIGGAVNSHPGVRLLRRISGIHDSRELAGVLAAVGLAQNYAACLALSTVGIQSGHMALHARSVAISVGVPGPDVEQVAQAMIHQADVKISSAEQIYASLMRERQSTEHEGDLPIEEFSPGKVVLFGEHATVYGYPGITAAVDIGLKVKITRDTDGPRFLVPRFKQVFNVQESDFDLQLFSRASDEALAEYGLQQAPIAVQIESELAPGMGLGSSAAFSAALCKALRSYKQRIEPGWTRDDLFDDVQRLESIFHGRPSGMDASTVLAGGVMWFRAGPPREILPLKLGSSLTGVICIIEPGARTYELVQQVHNSREMNPRRIDALLAEIGELTVAAGAALGNGNIDLTGRLMLQNHELLARLGVSTPGLDEAVEELVSNGAVGAKLTGSGGGGAVFALVHPEQQFDLIENAARRYPLVIPVSIGMDL